MKVNNFLHILGAIGAIGSIFSLHPYGWRVYQWPIISLLWIFSSYMNCLTQNRQKSEMDKIQKEKNELIDKLTKADMKAWEAEFKLAKSKS